MKHPINKFAAILAVIASFMFIDAADALQNNEFGYLGGYAYYQDGANSKQVTGGYYFEITGQQSIDILSQAVNGVWKGSINLPTYKILNATPNPITPPWEVGTSINIEFVGLPALYSSADRIEVNINYKNRFYKVQGLVNSNVYGTQIYVSIFPYCNNFPANGLINIDTNALESSCAKILYSSDNRVSNVDSIALNTFGLGIDNGVGGYNAMFTLDSILTILPFGTGPVQPVETVINGLTCQSNYYPDPQNVVWNNDFMNNTGFYSSIDDDGWIRFFSWSGSIYDLPTAEYVNRAALYYADQTAGGNFASGSLNYPGTERTNIRGGNKSPLLISFTDSEVQPNIVQWTGINSIGFRYAGTAQIQTSKLGETNEFAVSATGGVATVAVGGYDEIRKVLLNYSSGFNGFRYGTAENVLKNACSYKYNICEWSYEGPNLVCQSGDIVGGIPAGNCVITGSGSIYGSGSCIPETNASGAVIPPALVPGLTVFDGSGNVVGNIYEDKTKETPKLTCGYTENDGWLDTIGKTFKCVFQFFQKGSDTVSDGFTTIQGATQELGKASVVSPGTSTGETSTGSENPIINSFINATNGATETKVVQVPFAYFVMMFTVPLVALLAYFIKRKFSN